MKKDIFLSHSSKNKDFILQFHSLIEREEVGGRKLSAWIDDADIEIGESIPNAINKGLQNSKYVAICMSPSYFDQSGSGWTDAEWHSVLFEDPDNRGKRIIPILIENCPYIPALLRQFRYLDFRTDASFEKNFPKLISVLTGETQKVLSHRGRLLKGGNESYSMIDINPDVVEERAYSNLLPINELPETVFKFKISDIFLGQIKGPFTKAKFLESLSLYFMEAGLENRRVSRFRLIKNEVITLDASFKTDSYKGIFASCVEIETKTFVLNEDNRRVFISLLNMGIAEFIRSKKLTQDFSKAHRYYFPSYSGKPFKVQWRARKKLSTREVAKPIKDKDNKLQFWLHQASYIDVQFLNNNFYLKIEPTRVLTTDGKFNVMGGPNVSKKISKWMSPENNMHILLHIRFWTAILSNNSKGSFSIPFGLQEMNVGSISAFIKNDFGISHDQKDLLGQLDKEAEMITDLEMKEDEEFLKEAIVYDLKNLQKGYSVLEGVLNE